MKYQQFYRDHGIRFIRDLLDPIVWKSEAIDYPKSTMLFWPNGTGVLEYPTTEYGYFKHLNAPRVYTVLSYTTPTVLGDPKQKQLTEAKLFKEAKLKEPAFKYVRTGKNISVPSNSEVLFNLGALNTNHRYITHPLTDYYTWHNNLSTAVDLTTLNRTGGLRHKYIVLKLPYVIPSRNFINRYLGEPNRAMLTEFTDSSFFNMLELFRFIDEKYKTYSIINNNLKEDEFKYVDLILTINNTTTIVNLEMLASITEAYPITTKVKKYPTDTVSKIIYIFLNKLVTAAGMVTKDSKLIGIDGVTDIEIDKDEHVEEVVLDNIIDTEITDPQVLEDPSEDIDVLVADNIKEVTGNILTVTEQDTDFDTSEELTDNSAILQLVDDLKSNKVISSVVSKGLKESLDKQATIASPYNDGTKLASMLSPTIDEVVLDDIDATITDTPSVLDKSNNKDPGSLLRRQYNKETLKKDTLATIYAIQKSGVVIKDHVIENSNTVLGEQDTHTLTLQTLDGTKSTIKIILPVIADDGVMRLSGNKYTMRFQRAD